MSGGGSVNGNGRESWTRGNSLNTPPVSKSFQSKSKSSDAPRSPRKTESPLAWRSAIADGSASAWSPRKTGSTSVWGSPRAGGSAFSWASPALKTEEGTFGRLTPPQRSDEPSVSSFRRRGIVQGRSVTDNAWVRVRDLQAEDKDSSFSSPKKTTSDARLGSGSPYNGQRSPHSVSQLQTPKKNQTRTIPDVWARGMDSDSESVSSGRFTPASNISDSPSVSTRTTPVTLFSEELSAHLLTVKEERTKVFALSGKMTGDVSHVVANALINPHVKVVVLRNKNVDDPDHEGAQKIFDEAHFYLQNRVTMVDVDDSHRTYQHIIKWDKTGIRDVFAAGAATKQIAEHKDHVNSKYKQALNRALNSHLDRLRNYSSQTLGIDRDPFVYKTFFWSRMSGRNTGAHLENDTSSGGILELVNIDLPNEAKNIRRQIILVGDKHRTELDREPERELAKKEGVLDIREFWKEDHFKSLADELALPSPVVQTLLFLQLEKDGHVMMHVSPRSGNLDKLSMVLGKRQMCIQTMPSSVDHERVNKLSAQRYFEVIETDGAMTPRGELRVLTQERADDVSRRYKVSEIKSPQSGRIESDLRFISSQVQTKLLRKPNSEGDLKKFQESHERFSDFVRESYAAYSGSSVDTSVDLTKDVPLENMESKAPDEESPTYQMRNSDKVKFDALLKGFMKKQLLSVELIRKK